MSKSTVIYLTRFAENIRGEFGEEMAAQVLTGSDSITETTPNEKVAVWMNAALARLGEQVGHERLAGFSQNCGIRCADANLKPALASRKRRRASVSIDAFLSAEIANSTSTFTRMEREGDALAIYYTPMRGRKMRCFCPLMRQLPSDQSATVNYCQCSRAFTQRYWETILEQPVQVEITQSTLMGDKECKFLLKW